MGHDQGPANSPQGADQTCPKSARTKGDRKQCTPPTERSIQRVSQAPAIIKTRDPTAKCNLILTQRFHQRTTRNNTPGYVSAITRNKQPDIIPEYISRNHNVTKNNTLRCSPRLIGDTPAGRKVTFTPIQGSIASKAQSHIISQQALNAMTMKETLYPPVAFSPSHLECRHLWTKFQTMPTMPSRWSTRQQARPSPATRD